jgi:hypothetical protein
MGVFDWLSGSKPTKAKFAELMADALRQAGEPQELHFDPEEFQLIRAGENQHVLNLHNAFDEYCAAFTEDRPKVLQRFVRSWFSSRKEVPKVFAEARPDLLVGVRNRSYYEFARLQMRAQFQGQATGDFDWPNRVLAEHLAVGLVYDLPEAMMQIQKQSLVDWGVTFDEALAVALENLRSISRRRFDMARPGVWASPYHDNYDTARLLLIDFIRDHPVEGTPIAMIPNRDTLLFAGSEDEVGMEQMLAMAEEGLGQPRPITGIPFRLDGAAWEPYLPEAGHPLHQEFKLMWVKSIAMEYGDQQGLLNNLHEKTGQDLFVASYSAMQRNDTGEIVSYSVWSKGVDGLLPRTDLVHFFVPKAESDGNIEATADWATVMKVVGKLMKPQGMYPERFRVSAFPTDEQLRALAEA